MQPNFPEGTSINEYLGRYDELFFTANLWGLGNVIRCGSNRKSDGLLNYTQALYENLYSSGENGCECGG